MGLRDYVMQVGALMVASAAILAVWAVHARLQRPPAPKTSPASRRGPKKRADEDDSR